jgi:diadenosine tetraphosphate (Ap4A) HIT family hydrolase
MKTLRTREGEERYKGLIKNGYFNDGCKLCAKEPLKEFKYWKIVENAFPYDRIAEVHHMVLPKRHAKDLELTEEESQELDEIKYTYIHQSYSYILEATHHTRSIPDHFHLYLIITKDI